MSVLRLRVAAIILREGSVLLVTTRRGQEGYWVPPGGTVEPEETARHAVAREVQEEAGLGVSVGALLGYREVRRPTERVLELYFSATVGQNTDLTALVNEEGRRLVWAPVAELDRWPHFPEALADLCRAVAQGGLGALDLGTTHLP